MAANIKDNNREDSTFDPVSPLQERAWRAANKAYHVPDGESYRAAGIDLYRQATHERIQELLARSDAQNAYLDIVLSTDGRAATERALLEDAAGHGRLVRTTSEGESEITALN